MLGKRLWAMLLAMSVAMAALVSMPSAAYAEGPMRSIAAKSGKLKVTVQAPKGVPATVVVSKGKSKVTAAKKASGKRKVVTKKAASGTWRIKANPVQHKGKFYVATLKKSQVKVRGGKTTKVKVVYKRAKMVSGLKVSKLTETQLGLTFKKPKKNTQVRIRYALGTKAPKSVKSGKAVKVGTKSATLKKLKPGTTYSISVFTRIGKKWVGPLTQTVGTKTKKAQPKPKPPVKPDVEEEAAFIANLDTVLVQPMDLVPAIPVGGGVQAILPADRTPMVGQPVVLPITDALPGGFIGKVKSIGADGQTVLLEQAALTEAFDYLNVSVPDLSEIPFEEVARTVTSGAEDALMLLAPLACWIAAPLRRPSISLHPVSPRRGASTCMCARWSRRS